MRKLSVKDAINEALVESFQNDKNVFTFSMHCGSNYPAKKSKSDIDVELNDFMEDEEYLNILCKNLKVLNNERYDFVFYVAGVDIHFEDRLGKLKITDEGINKRDQIVIENFYSRKVSVGISSYTLWIFKN